MPNYNKVILMGNLTRDPELSYLPSNTPVVNAGLAVNRKFKRSDGEQGEETLFIDLVAFGRQGEVINQYVKKGHPLMVEGRLRLDQWEDKQSGQKRSRHKVVVEQFQLLGKGDEQGGGQSRQPQNSRTAPQQRSNDQVGFDDFSGDPPF